MDETNAETSFEVDWDQLSVRSNESFFERPHFEHEPMHKAVLKSAMRNKENIPEAKKSLTDVKKPREPIKQRKTLPNLPTLRKAPATVPITPNVLRNRCTRPKFNKAPEPYVFKAKPAPVFKNQNNGAPILLPRPRLPAKTRSDPDFKDVTKKLDKCQLSQPILRKSNKENLNQIDQKKIIGPQLPTKPVATVRPSRLAVRSEAPLLKRSKSVPIRPLAPRVVTEPMTPNVLKRQRRTTSRVPSSQSEVNLFKAKPAKVLQREPFRPTLNIAAASSQQSKPFQLNLENRLKSRKTFDHKTTDALHKRNKLVADDKQKIEDLAYAEARRRTNFKANPNPFK